MAGETDDERKCLLFKVLEKGFFLKEQMEGWHAFISTGEKAESQGTDVSRL